MQDSNDISSSLVKHGIDIGIVIAGFAGAVILNIKNRKKSIAKSIACIIAGTLCATYMTPLVLNISPEYVKENGKYAVAFMMGYTGLKILDFLSETFMGYISEKNPFKRS